MVFYIFKHKVPLFLFYKHSTCLLWFSGDLQTYPPQIQQVYPLSQNISKSQGWQQPRTWHIIETPQASVCFRPVIALGRVSDSSQTQFPPWFCGLPLRKSWLWKLLTAGSATSWPYPMGKTWNQLTPSKALKWPRVSILAERVLDWNSIWLCHVVRTQKAFLVQPQPKNSQKILWWGPPSTTKRR